MIFKTVNGLFATESDFRHCQVEVRAEKSMGKKSISLYKSNESLFIRCPECGVNIESSKKFCPCCGTILPVDVEDCESCRIDLSGKDKR